MKNIIFLALFISLTLNSLSQFGPKNLIDSSMAVNDFTISDINNDGLLDITVCERYLINGIAYSLNLGNGKMDTLKSIANMYQPWHIASGDLDNDGKMDIITAQNGYVGNLHILYNNFPSFNDIIIDSAIRYVNDIKIADIDNNGKDDIVITSSSINVFYNQGSGVFTKTIVPYPNMVGAHEVYDMDLGDINNDGWIDMVYAGGDYFVLKNDSGILVFDSLASISINPGRYQGHNMKLGDMNNDNYLDIVYASYSNDKDLIIDTNQGNGRFGFYASIDSNLLRPNTKIELKELNNDGNLDVITFLGQNPFNLVWYENNSNGNFSSPNVIFSSIRGYRVASEDINNDGLNDIIWGNELAYHLKINPVGIDEKIINNKLHFYPNPANDRINFEAESNGDLTIYDSKGMFVNQYIISKNGLNSISLNLMSGSYIIQFVTNEGDFYYNRLIISK